MSNPNLVTVYSPEGEPFETSRANARDLMTHAGWSNAPTEIAAITVPPVKADPVVETPAAPKDNTDASNDADGEGSIEDTAETGNEAGEEAGEEEGAEARAVTAEDFADLEDRDAVVAYLATHFPAFKPHHKSSRDGLVDKLVGLVNG